MSDSRKNGNRKPISKKLRTSKHLLNFVDTYVDDKTVSSDIVEAHLAKSPKSYGQVFNRLFRASKRTLFAFHLCSFILAFPLIFSLVWQFILRQDKAELNALFQNVIDNGTSAMTLKFILPLFIAGLVLALAEYWQHVTLNDLFEIYFQRGKHIVTGLAFLAVLFSCFSIVSSSYGASEVVSIKNVVDPIALSQINLEINDALRSRKATRGPAEVLKRKDAEIQALRDQRTRLHDSNESNTLKYSNILFYSALLIEILIVTSTFNIHNYQFKTSEEVSFINDLGTGYDALNLGFEAPKITAKSQANTNFENVFQSSGLNGKKRTREQT